MALTVRPFRGDDLDAIERVTAASYGRPMSPPMRVRIAIQPRDVLVAETDGAIVGTVSASCYGSHAYVASMAVDPSRRREGIARALLAALLDDLASRAVVTIELDATDAGAPLYVRFGFVDVDRTLIVERESTGERRTHERDVDIGSEAFARALELDRFTFGCDRGDVLRALALEAGAALTCTDDAYALSREDVLGPWIAHSEAAARSTFERAIEMRPTLARAFVPESNARARAIVAERGFRTTRTLRHMTRGMTPTRREFVYAQASLGHG